MAHHQAASAPLPDQTVNKWDLLRELTVARQQFDLSDRALAVLQALLSFHPGTDLGADPSTLIVFPSNDSICDRLNGMPCSTMRRHLAALIRAGLILRRDSPNGKRFARHSPSGRQAFGFDLSPLCQRFVEVCAIAAEVRAKDQAYTRLRQTVSLMRRDLAGLAIYGADTHPLPLWDGLRALADHIARLLRRKLSMDELSALETELLAALNTARDVLDDTPSDVISDATTTELSIIPRQNEQHHQSSDKEHYESEPCLDNDETHAETESPLDPPSDRQPNLPLRVVKDACPKVQTYAPGPIRHWHQLVYAVETIRPMMGIAPSAWDDAVRIMGPENAATVVAAMLERFTDLRSPGGYLRSLTKKAAAGAFSSGPMVMALLRTNEA